jgi:hypothetical protein
MWIWMCVREREFHGLLTLSQMGRWSLTVGIVGSMFIERKRERVKPQGTKNGCIYACWQQKRPFCLKVFAIELQKKLFKNFCLTFFYSTSIYISHSPLSAINKCVLQCYIFHMSEWTNKEIIFELLVSHRRMRKTVSNSFIMRKLSHSLIMISSLFCIPSRQKTATYAHFLLLHIDSTFHSSLRLLLFFSL